MSEHLIHCCLNANESNVLLNQLVRMGYSAHVAREDNAEPEEEYGWAVFITLDDCDNGREQALVAIRVVTVRDNMHHYLLGYQQACSDVHRLVMRLV